MPKAASFSPLQVFTPIQLIFCLILFFLPWIELQCVPPASEVKSMPKEKIEEVKKEFGVDPTKPIGMFSQSGFQIASGNVSLTSDMKRIAEKTAQMFGAKSEKVSDTEVNEKLKKEDDVKAPLLYLYPVALLGGIVLGFIPWPGMPRKIIVASCCAAALGVVGIQAAVGFPLETKLKDKLKTAGGGGAMKFPGGAGGKTDTKESESQRVTWKLPLYASLLLLLGATGTAFLGATAGKPQRGRKRRRDYDEEDEDEDEDEEDDRPRRKKKKPVVEELPDEDEEEEKPRKKGKSAAASGNPFDFDDDDEPPKKKPKRRDDDDDEDDRPRRKKRRDDDD